MRDVFYWISICVFLVADEEAEEGELLVIDFEIGFLEDVILYLFWELFQEDPYSKLSLQLCSSLDVIDPYNPIYFDS